MNQKNSRNEKHNYSKEKKLALVESENTSALQILSRRMTATFSNCYRTYEKTIFNL